MPPPRGQYRTRARQRLFFELGISNSAKFSAPFCRLYGFVAEQCLKEGVLVEMVKAKLVSDGLGQRTFATRRKTRDNDEDLHMQA